MLTLEINDARLEQKILEKARSIGKSAQEMLKDLVVEKMQEEEKANKLPFEIPKIDYRKHIKIIDYGIDDENIDDENIDDAPIFQDIGDTVEFAKKLRDEAWKRKF